jgi:hypothetical protein
MKSKNASTLGQQLFRYGIGAGAASLAASAQATIEYSGVLNISGNDIAFSMQGLTAAAGTNPTADFQLESDPSKAKAGINGQAPSSGAAAASGYAFKLSNSATIGSNLTFQLGYSSLQDNFITPGTGNWHPGDEGFLGLTFLFNGSTAYGWADVTLNNLDGTGPGVFTLHGFAFEDSGAAIAAGATAGGSSSVPDSGSTLMLLAAGATGVLALKRRQANA